MAAGEQGGGHDGGVDWSILIGPGSRLAGLDEVLGALSPSVNGPLEVALGRFEELSQLLAPGFRGPGRVLLDADAVAPDEVGFVRWFLTRQEGWELVLVGDDPGERRARALLALAAVRWLPWPPDLEQLRWLATSPLPAPEPEPVAEESPAPASEAPAPGREELADLSDLAQRLRLSFHHLRTTGSWSDADLDRHQAEIDELIGFTRGLKGDPAPAPATAPAPSGAASSQVDVATLLEEKLTALGIDRAAPGYRFEGDAPLFVQADPRGASAAFDEVLSVARSCTQPGGEIRVQAERASNGRDLATVAITWPAGPLAELSDREVLETARLESLVPGAGAALSRARSALSQARIDLRKPDPEHVVFEARFSAAGPA